MGLYNPAEFDESTGLFPNDEDAKIIGAAIVRYDYNGKQATPVPCIRLDLVGEDTDKPVEQYFGVGKAEDWAPSADGKKLNAIGKRTRLHKSSNAAMLFKSMYEAGVPVELLDAASEDITALVGLEAHWVRAKIRREGLKDKDGKDKEFEALMVTQVVSLPGDASTGAKGGVAVADKATAAILKFVASNGKKGVKKADLPTMVLGDADLMSDPDRDKMLALMITDDAFLANGPWEFKSGTIKAAA